MKILKNADQTPIQRVCKNTFFDAIRYTMKAKYGYKKHFLGKDRFTWDLLFGIGVAIFALAVILLCWIFS